ncbi:MAG TPA: zinc ribbon domain-containing protein [Anaerolineaceae bacterium]|nr:zinc ribbon domain-containing protein [Anaerolineaceae bacterium]HPN53173.1 zinc ribbon domain-containing protein [Anaerolineaceae bacterium]
MDAGAILLILSVILITGLIIGQPLLHPAAPPSGPARPGRYAEQLASLEALEMDLTQGKISPEDYPAARARLMNQAAAALNAETETQLPLSSDAIEAAVLARRSNRAFCPGCGKPVLADDVFCAKCGRKLH